MTIHLNREQELLVGQAIQAGLIETPDDLVRAGVETIKQRLEALVAPEGALQREEWLREFRAWVHSHPTNTPLLSEETISRESIYGNRGR